jgi:hypothetical protein
MAQKTTRSVKEGIGFGLVAGVIFALVEIAASTMMGSPALAPLRMFASVVLGESAMETATPGTAILVGSIAHLVLSGLYGLVYGLVNAMFSTKADTGWARQAVFGLLFGAAIWLVNFQLFARILYPWFLDAPQLAQLLLHSVAFGLPLALMYAGAERRVQIGGRAGEPA